MIGDLLKLQFNAHRPITATRWTVAVFDLIGRYIDSIEGDEIVLRLGLASYSPSTHSVVLCSKGVVTIRHHDCVVITKGS